MRANLLLLAIAASAGIAGTVLWSGCGGSSDDTATNKDSGSDVTLDQGSGQDTGSDAVADAGCGDAPDFSTFNPPDADLNDAGGNTVRCAACARAHCKNDIDQCNANCDCRQAGVDFYNCIAGGRSIITCAQQTFAGLTDPGLQAIGQSLLLCAYANCRVECGIPALGDGGRDGATTDSGSSDGGSTDSGGGG